MALRFLVISVVNFADVTNVEAIAIGKHQHSKPNFDSTIIGHDTSLPELKHRQIVCEGGNRTIPAEMMMIKGKVAWCPNAKVGTTYIFERLEHVLGLSKDIRCNAYTTCDHEGLKSLEHFSDEALCKATTYTWIRNPWDRIRSAYEEKIKTGLINPWSLYENTHGPAGTPTFAQFVRFVSQQKPKDMDHHWMPASYRCLVGWIKYNHMNKLEQGFDKEVDDMFVKAGLNRQSVECMRNESVGCNPNHNTEHTIDSRTAFYWENGDSISSPHDLVEMVAEIYQNDIEAGHFSFNKFS